MKTFTLQVFREYPLSSQRWSCPQEYLTDYVSQQFLLHISQIGKSFSLKPCWKKTGEFARMACLYVIVCVVVFQNANFEGQNRRRPSVNSKSVSHKKSFLRSLGLLGNESQLLSEDFHSAGLQRISFIISTVKLSARVLNRLCVPAVSSSFQLNWQEFQPEA